jgi:hypothetical protein
MQKAHTMSTDSLETATDTTDLTSATADTSAVAQPVTGDTAAVGSPQGDTPASAETAPSQPNTSSTTPTDPLDNVGKFAHGKPNQSAQPITPPATQEQPEIPAWLQQKLGIKDHNELNRLAGMNQLYGRQATEVGTLRQQIAQLESQQQAAQQKAQEEAQRLNLSPFHSRHPQHQQNTARVQAFGAFRSALQGLPPELQNDPAARARLAQAMRVTPDDEKLYQQQEQYSLQVRQEMESDPDAFVERRVERLLNERLQQYEQYQEAKVAAKGLIQQHQPLIEKHSDRMNWILDPNVPARDKAIWAASQEAKVAELMASKVPEAQQVETLKARNQLAQRQVAPTRTAAAVAPNPHAEYAKTKNPEQLLDDLFGKAN